MAIIVINNIEATQEEIRRRINTTLEAVGLFVKGKSKEITHVVTGNLRSSIDHEVYPEQNKVAIGTNVEYAEEEHFRPGEKPGFGPHAFLKPAAENNIEEIRQIIISYMGGTI